MGKATATPGVGQALPPAGLYVEELAGESACPTTGQPRPTAGFRFINAWPYSPFLRAERGVTGSVSGLRGCAGLFAPRFESRGRRVFQQASQRFPLFLPYRAPIKVAQGVALGGAGDLGAAFRVR
jgi:hypothetical protein